jgi:hypothetical protein
MTRSELILFIAIWVIYIQHVSENVFQQLLLCLILTTLHQTSNTCAQASNSRKSNWKYSINQDRIKHKKTSISAIAFSIQQHWRIRSYHSFFYTTQHYTKFFVTSTWHTRWQHAAMLVYLAVIYTSQSLLFSYI